MIRDEPEVLALYREAMVEKHGGDRKSEQIKTDIVNLEKPDAGNSKAYTLSRLQRESPELFKEVCDGKLSANAAENQAPKKKIDTPHGIP